MCLYILYNNEISECRCFAAHIVRISTFHRLLRWHAAGLYVTVFEHGYKWFPLRILTIKSHRYRPDETNMPINRKRSEWTLLNIYLPILHIQLAEAMRYGNSHRKKWDMLVMNLQNNYFFFTGTRWRRHDRSHRLQSGRAQRVRRLSSLIQCRLLTSQKLFCKSFTHYLRPNNRAPRGYIAMLAVDKPYRHQGVGILTV